MDADALRARSAAARNAVASAFSGSRANRVVLDDYVVRIPCGQSRIGGAERYGDGYRFQ